MKRIGYLVSTVVVVLAVGSVALAAAGGTTPYQAPAASTGQAPASFQVQAKLLQVGKGWVQVEIMKVEKGGTLKTGAKLRIIETARTKFLQAGKAVSVKDLKAGETVEIIGIVVRSGKTLTYRAASITIME